MGKRVIAWCPCCGGLLVEERAMERNGNPYREMQCAQCSRVIEILPDTRGYLLRVPARRPDVERYRAG